MEFGGEVHTFKLLDTDDDGKWTRCTRTVMCTPRTSAIRFGAGMHLQEAMSLPREITEDKCCSAYHAP